MIVITSILNHVKIKKINKYILYIIIYNYINLNGKYNILRFFFVSVKIFKELVKGVVAQPLYTHPK